MQKKLIFMFKRLRYVDLLLFLFYGLFLVIGCSGGNESGNGGPGGQTGVFLDSPVSGLNYSTPTLSGHTDPAGGFSYKSGEIITLSIGSLTLGSAPGGPILTPISIISGVTGVSDQRVVNMCVLLQTLDADGDLNNNIQITPAIADIVSGFAGKINFDQTTDAFQADANVAALLAKLNAASPVVFSDIPQHGLRTLRSASDASAHFKRSLRPRKIVNTEYGQLSGYASDASTWQFLGVPYATPPIGDLRWRPPHAPTVWTGVRQAIEWGDQAAQPPDSTDSSIGGAGGVSEDCLHLNITTPQGASNLPVMVWLHGGGFVALTGNSPNYNNYAGLTTQGVIVITVNHRLGAFGYLADPLLTAESGYNGSGNYGQMDLIAALQWVKKNIANFGGNPNNVTIFGESGGGGKVTSLMSSHLATGLFQKAICESGIFPQGQKGTYNYTLNTPPLEYAEAVGTLLFSNLGVTTLAEARAVPWQKIVADATYSDPSNFPYGPNQDEYYATTDMYTSLKTELPSDVPFLAGINAGDAVGLIPGLVAQMPLRSLNNRAPQFVYKFSKVPEGWAPLTTRNILAYHMDELTYVFNYPLSVVANYYIGCVIDQNTNTPLVIDSLFWPDANPKQIYADAAWGTSDWIVAGKMMSIWTNFAKTGNPSITGFTWPAYTGTTSNGGNDTYVEIGTSHTTDTTLKVKMGLSTATDPWP